MNRSTRIAFWIATGLSCMQIARSARSARSIAGSTPNATRFAGSRGLLLDDGVRVAPAVVAASLGVFAGTGVVTFQHAEGLSYLSTDPRACVNCHIMRPQYDSWQKASHHHWARCVDCHLPHDFVRKYMAKARNGWFHSKGFTLQDFPEPIVITPPNARILQENCVGCHEGLVHAIGDPQCVHCHADVGHGEQVGLGGAFHEEEIPR